MASVYVTQFNVAANGTNLGTVNINGNSTYGGQELTVDTFAADGIVNVNAYAYVDIVHRSHIATLIVSGTNAQLFMETSQDVGDLTIDSGGFAKLQPRSAITGNSAIHRVLYVHGSLDMGSDISPGGMLDLTNCDLIVHDGAVGTWNGSHYIGISGLIRSGRNGGSWNGNGIRTSVSTSGNYYSFGIATAQQAKNLTNPTDTTTFAGETVTGTDVLIKFTYGGDANIDGKINVDDYGRIDFNVSLGTDGWFNGDFNYDGKINVDDYGIIDFNVGIQGGTIL